VLLKGKLENLYEEAFLINLSDNVFKKNLLKEVLAKIPSRNLLKMFPF